MSLKWNGPKVREQILAEMRRRIFACCILVASEAKKLISIAGTGRGRHKDGRFRTIYGASPSAPGEPPHKQTGHLRRSITYEVLANMVGRVGTNEPYGRFLELGTRKMKARPWLRVAFRNVTARILAVLSRPMQ